MGIKAAASGLGRFTPERSGGPKDDKLFNGD
jgi:hypothetical protein